MLTWLAIVLAAGAADSVAAVDTTAGAELGKIIVTATRRETQLSKAPVVSYVVDSSDFATVRAAHASEALMYVPGIDVETGTGVGLPSKRSISINGLPSFHTVVLVDGHRLLSSHFHTGANIDIVPPENIERIEVIKDASSAMYGSDALGGVVNIITKRGAAAPALELFASGGSQQTVRGGVSVRGNSGDKIFHSVYAGWEQSEGLPIVEGRRKDQLEYKQLSLMDKFDIVASDNLRVGASVHYSSFMDLQSGTAFYNAWLLTPGVNVDWNIGKNFGLSGRAYYTRWDADISNERNELVEDELTLSYTGLKHNTIMLGGNFQWRNFARDGVLEQDQRLIGAFVQDELVLGDKASILGALRVDYVDNTALGSEDNGPRLSPKISAVVRPVDALAIRAGIGSGFRAPYVQDLYESRYHPSGGGIWRYGNPDLVPEESIGLNGGLDWRMPSWLQLGAYGYYNSLTNMIALVRGTWDSAGVEVPRDTLYNARRVPVWERQNVNDYRIGGCEGWMRLEFKYVDVYAGVNGSWQASDDPKAAEALLYPGHKVFATVSGRAPAGKALELNGFVGMQHVFGRSAPGGNGELADYTNLEAGIGALVVKRFDFYIKVRNLLGQEIDMYEDALWTIEGTRMFEAGVKARVF